MMLFWISYRFTAASPTICSVRLANHPADSSRLFITTSSMRARVHTYSIGDWLFPDQLSSFPLTLKSIWSSSDQNAWLFIEKDLWIYISLQKLILQLDGTNVADSGIHCYQPKGPIQYAFMAHGSCTKDNTELLCPIRALMVILKN